MKRVVMLGPVAVLAPTVGVGGLAAAMAAAVSATLLIGAGSGAGTAGLSGALGSGTTGSAGAEAGVPAAGTSVAGIPVGMQALYREATAAVCPGMAWQVLAAVGTEESGNGTSDAPGVHSGANSAGAEGPMQFEPATFAAYDRPVPPGGANPPSPYDPVDAVYAAARMLCADGGGRPGTVGQALYAYNHSASYVSAVLSIAESYGYADGPSG